MDWSDIKQLMQKYLALVIAKKGQRQAYRNLAQSLRATQRMPLFRQTFYHFSAGNNFDWYQKMVEPLSKMDSSQYRVDINITLTDKERQIFDTLMELVTEQELKTTLRVAGGWVRDKIMGKESVDIDIALDNMSGQEFAEKLDAKLHPGAHKKGYGVIGLNNQLSKHLETATMPVHGMNTDESRVPQITIGTPEQDAFRRDLTINALFYNINKGKVEDYTKMGESDLMLKVVRTPLEPLQTFLDDPLRVLRTVRFATRFDFKMAPEIHGAATDKRVIKALEEKVSYERIMKELDLMFCGKFPANSIKYLYDFGVIQSILKIPPKCLELQNEEKVQSLIYESLKLSQVLGGLFLKIRSNADPLTGESAFAFRHFHGVGETVENEKAVDEFKNFQCNTFYSSLLLPFHPFEYKKDNGKKFQVVEYILTESLKKPANSIKYVLGVHPYVEKAIQFAQQLSQLHEPINEELKLQLGWYLREAGHRWDSVYLLAIAKEYFNTIFNVPGEAATSEFNVSESHLLQIIEKYGRLNQVINEEQLDKVHMMRPALDGNDVCLLYQIKAGKALKFLLEEQLKFQITHPSAGFAEVSQFLTENKDAFLVKYQ
ncbi:hypothetical protein FGO68_gene295 [Halteria grandinella]|uniref:Poly A polymerase head domain-containing protein n=1 Tax=Halteria grandinella TaxID=5974 RepID=A0A8J8T502_HALGN|nr:hypothetical protein FGO68_gene295 [Halteria grandinella]